MSPARPLGLAIVDHDGIDFTPSEDALLHDASSLALLGHPLDLSLRMEAAREHLPHGQAASRDTKAGRLRPATAFADGRTQVVFSRSLFAGAASVALACTFALPVASKGARSRPHALKALLSCGLLALGGYNLLVLRAVRRRLGQGRRAVPVPVVRWAGFWLAKLRSHPREGKGGGGGGGGAAEVKK